MDVSALKAQIKTKQLSNYLIFSGAEWKVQEIYINQIAKVTDKEIKRIDSITDIYSQLKNRSFIKKSCIYVVRDDKELMQNEKLQQQISNGLLNENILIHLVTSVDKRTKFYKTYKDTIIEFEALPDAILKKYILKEIQLSDNNVQRLINICEHDYGRILLEIDKIKRYVEGCVTRYGKSCDVNIDEVFESLVNNGTIYQPPYDAIFDLVDVILNRKINKTFDLLQQSYDVGEATLVMLTVLYNNAKAVLQIQTYEGNNLSQGTGLTGWQIQNVKSHINKYSNEELINMLKLIQKCESGIKSGIMEDEYAMEYLLVKIL